MNCEQARERMMEWMDGRLSPAAANDLKAHVDACPACQAELAATRRMAALLDAPAPVRPSPALRQNVFAAIEEERRRSGAPAAFSPPSAALRAAGNQAAEGRQKGEKAAMAPLLRLLQAFGACALIAVGYVAGTHRPGPATPAPAPANDTSSAASRQEVAELRARLDSMGQLVGYTLQQQQRSSTNQRLETVLTTAALPQPDRHAIDALISTLALDPSVNVRLSAVQALYPHADQDVVRTAMAISLPRESCPLVQVAMIDFLVAAKDTAAAPVLDRLSNDTTVDQTVRDAAGRAVAQLRRPTF